MEVHLPSRHKTLTLERMAPVDVSPGSTRPRLKSAVGSWYIPISAWIISRMIGVVGLVVWPTAEGKWFNSFGLTYMDGGWYRIIMTIGYPNGPVPDFSTSWPFSPLYPFVADLLTRLGVPVGPSLILVSWIFALVALVGIWELTRVRFGQAVARNAVWCLALLPGAVGQVLSYSDSMFSAGLVWLLVVIDRIVAKDDVAQQRINHQWWLVGLLSLVITASRPNGILVLIAVVCAVWMSQRQLINFVAATLPSILFFVSWMVYCKNKTGDPLAFLTAKNTWLETTIVDFLSDPFERPAIILHVATFVIAGVVALMAIKKVPIWWQVASGVLLIPSLIVGVEGLARYVSLAIPMSVLIAISISPWSKLLRSVFLIAAASSMLFLAVNVVRSAWVP